MKRHFSKAMIVAALLVAAGQPVRADIIITNYPFKNDADASAISVVGGTNSKAGGFTLGAGPAYSLDSVTLRLTRGDLAATLRLDLFGDDGGNPSGPVLVSFLIPEFSLGTSDVVFTPAAAFTLQPLTTYWLAATGNSPTQGGINWRAVVGSGGTPTGIATSAGYRFDFMGGYPPTTSSSIRNIYQVNGSPVVASVPEPRTLIPFAGALLALSLVRARERRRQRAASWFRLSMLSSR